MALQPIPNYSIENPMVGLTSTLQTIQGLRQMQSQQDRAQQMQAALESASNDPSPENLAQIYLRFPEMKEQMDAYRETLGEADKNTMTSAAREAIITAQTGRPEEVAGVFERYAEAADNSGRQDMAQKFRDAARVARENPDAAVLTARTLYNGIDPEGYKNVFQSATTKYDTAFLKELIAEGLEPGTPEFQQALREKREGDPWIVVPGIGLYRKEDVQGLASGEVAAPAIPDAAAAYLRENPNLRKQFDEKYGEGAANRILGGGTAGNGGGGF